MVVIRQFIWLIALVSVVGCSRASLNNQAQLVTVPDQALLYTTADQLWVSDESGESRQSIITATGQVQSAVWLHNNQALLYVVRVGEYFQIWHNTLQPSSQATLVLASHTLPEQLVVSPHDKFLTYFEDDIVYVIDLLTLQRTRLYEGATGLAWSPNGRQFIITTSDQRVILYAYSVQGELTDPVVLLSQLAVAPTFSNAHTLVFEGMVDGRYALQSFDLNTEVLSTVSGLRFDTSNDTVRLVLSPDATALLYTRPDDVTAASTVWLVHLNQDKAPQLILNHAKAMGWASDSQNIYYQSTLNQALYRATPTGLDKIELFTTIQSLHTRP